MASKNAKSNTEETNNQASPPPPLHSSDQWVLIGTGNHYKGNWNHRTMSGYGIYVMLDGTVYKGNFDDGLFHGIGTAYHPSGSRIEGVWGKGKCIKRNYIFNDGLRFQPENWHYCEMPDRRFVIEHVKGLQPAAKSWMTNWQPTIKIPDDQYDAGDGFYRPLTNTVHNYWTNALIRVPTVEGGKWIMENCRRGGHRIVGFRPELHENWYETNKNVSSVVDIKPIPTDDGESMITDIKTVPSPVFDLSLHNIKLQQNMSSFSGCQPNHCQKTVLTAHDERPRSSSNDEENHQ
ncbi:Hypothetical protein CINCED_3A008622 [Cinara cedri]|uniref:MORN repeat-containing protein 5 n=1 Tax=Cinara cedri TaxID=506608 RepID=A0A5E4MYB7_9HEMI|nr:Hypothetical protein CINCED_3A008622 [Cinara cedri]